jgi:hypothetical protein
VEIRTPKGSILETPHLIERDMANAKKSFYELARSRIIYRNQECHSIFQREIDESDRSVSSACLILQRKFVADICKWITGLEISVNKDFFGEENADLIPYAVEHEIYEAWLYSKRGYSPQSVETGHLLARRREYEMAMRDGKAEKLLNFHKKVNLSIAREIEYAYQKARDKKEHSRPQE